MLKFLLSYLSFIQIWAFQENKNTSIENTPNAIKIN
jgi:hypothetical protein